MVVLLGAIFFFAPKFSALEEEMGGDTIRKFGSFTRSAFIVCAFIIASNVFQAFVSTGIPPYYGQGDPVRFTLDPKYIIWDDSGYKNHWKKVSFLGKRDVAAPDYAFAPAGEKLGVKFDNDPTNAPLAVDENLSIASKNDISFAKPINSLDFINGEFVASSKWEVFFMDENFKVTSDFEIDPYFSATVDPIIGVIPFMGDKYMLMGSNKTLLRFAKNPKADEVLQYADFMRGNDKFEGQGKGLGRSRSDTGRAKFHHVASIATDGTYCYLATVPNNKDAQKFVISKILLSDRTLSGEFTPKAALKEGKSLGDLYVTSMAYKEGLLYALSKNHNVIAIINPKTEEIVKTLAYPSEITNARSIFFKDGAMNILSYQDGKNTLYRLN